MRVDPESPAGTGSTIVKLGFVDITICHFGRRIWKLVVPYLHGADKYLINITTTEGFNLVIGVTYHSQLQAIRIKAVTHELVVFCPPVIVAGKCYRAAHDQIPLMQNVGSSGWREAPLVTIYKIITEFTV